MIENNVLVSVCMMTYNHEEFVSQAIESVLMQRSNFKYELVIGEDISTDSTREICLKYEKNYPDIINVIPRTSNLGMVPNFLDVFTNCKGKYIALIEGDDYWTSPQKLQKQVEILESNARATACFHNAYVLYQDKVDQSAKLFNARLNKEIELKDIIKEWCIPTASLVFRKESLDLPKWFIDIRNWDWAIEILLASKGVLLYDKDPQSMYRKHLGGNSFNPDYNNLVTANRLIKLLGLLNNHFNFQYDKIISQKSLDLQKEIDTLEFKEKQPILYWLFRPKKLIIGVLRKVVVG